jgi:hypothetical protein
MRIGKQWTQIQEEGLWEDKEEWRRPTQKETSMNDYVHDGEKKISTTIVFAKLESLNHQNKHSRVCTGHESFVV